MADNTRIDDLRRRVQKDPASIAFAQLAEELRRAGQLQESVDTCRAGLAIHPGYLSAHVTLGRALIELNELDDAQGELELVLKSAPENLAAIRGMGEIHHRRGELPQALAQYRSALILARNDPDLEQTVAQLARQVEPPKPAKVDDGLSFEQMQSELLKLAPPPAPPTAPPAVVGAELAPPLELAPPWEVAPPAPLLEPGAEQARPLHTPDNMDAPSRSVGAELAPPLELAPPWELPLHAEHVDIPPVVVGAELAPPWELADIPPVVVGAELAPPWELAPPAAPPVPSSTETERALRTVAALQQWLDAIHVARPDPRA